MADRTGQQFDNYRLIQLLGRGAFGEVYLGEQIARQTQVAVKVLAMRMSNDELYDFINEARIFRLRHPNIVTVLDFGVERATETPFLVMTYAPNGTLRQRHPRGTSVPLAQIVQYVKQVAGALQYAHDEGLVHRDVKPENMLLDEEGNVLLSDFGIAVVSQSQVYSGQQNPLSAGTPIYMAPEQFLGKSSRAGDQYALGVVVYEWLSGAVPFRGTFYELVGQHLQVAPPPLPLTIPLYSQKLEQIVMKALAKNPEDRFASVWEFATALEERYKEALVRHQAPTIYAQPEEQCLQEGDTLYDQQRYQEAIRAYSTAIALAPTDASAYHRRGLAYRQIQDIHRALANYDRAIELDPTNAITYNNRGYAYSLLQDYEKALADYDHALVIEPQYSSAYTNRGNAYCALGQFDKAIADYDAALVLSPEYALAYYNRGNAYDELQDYEKALTDYDRAIEINPAYANAYNNRGRVYRTLGAYEKAVADYDQVIALEPDNINAYNGRGLAYNGLKVYGKALADFERALELDPNQRSVQSNKAHVLQELYHSKDRV